MFLTPTTSAHAVVEYPLDGTWNGAYGTKYVFSGGQGTYTGYDGCHW